MLSVEVPVPVSIGGVEVASDELVPEGALTMTVRVAVPVLPAESVAL